MVKLGTTAIARQREFTEGKIGQQVGVKPSQASIKRQQQAEAERQAIIKENKRIEAANKKAEEEYLAEKKRIEEINARQEWLYSKINEQLKSQDYAGSSPSGLSSAEKRIWDDAMSSGASSSVSIASQGLYTTGKVYYKGETEGTFTPIAPTSFEPELVAVTYQEQEQQEPFDFNKYVKEHGVSQTEIKRYEELGYSSKESMALARESEQLGGVSFSPDYAKTIVAPTWTFKDEPVKYSVYKSTEQYLKADEFVKQKVTYPTFDFIESKTGLDLTTVESQRKISPYSLVGVGSYGINVLPKKFRPSSEGFEEGFKEFTGGISAGIYKDVKEKPLKQVAIYGASAGLGFAFKGTSIGLGLIPKVGSYASPVFKATTTVGGLYLLGSYTYSTGKSVFTAGSPGEAGAITGVAAKDIFLFGKGFKAGEKGFLKAQGEWQFYKSGRTVIPQEKLIPDYILTKESSFPKTQGGKLVELKTFQESPYNLPIKRQINYGKGFEIVYPETYQKLPFKTPSTAYHATPNIFYDKVLSASAGTSELPGTYFSYSPSVHFLKVGGSGSSYSFKGFFQSILSPDGRPGIAAIQPEGFRISPVTTTKPYTIGKTSWFNKLLGGEKKFKWKWNKPTKEGVLDLPGMKTGGEAESILRIDAGSYRLVGQEWGTTWEGVKIPIDVFRYDASLSSIIPSTSGTGSSLLSGISGGSYSQPTTSYFPLSVVKFSYKPSESSYSRTTSLISPTSSITKSRVSSISKISRGSRVSRTSSYISPPTSRTTSSSSIRSSIKPPTSRGGSSIRRSYLPPPTTTTTRLPRIKIKAPKRISKSLKSPKGIVSRAPSLWALGERITAPKAAKREFTGLGLRPIIIPGLKKKRKRRKRK